MTSCPVIITGDQFLLRVLAHIDCQAQVIGSYGYQALGQPGSPAVTLAWTLLTLFIAFFGIKLLFGPKPGARDIVFDVLKIGIVLTLVFSWPAFRTVIYDVTLKGPAEITSVIQGGTGQGASSNLPERLQTADNQLVRLAEVSTGRNVAPVFDGQGPGSSFAGTALSDDEALGSARLLFLANVIGSLALLRIAGGLLLALAPLVAGLYFFDQSRGIFAGWLKGLVLVFAGSVGASIVLGLQLSIIEPWLTDALQMRAAGYATPSAPIEIFAISLAFALVQLVMFWLLAKIVFNRGWLTLPDLRFASGRTQEQPWLAAPNIPAGTERVLRTERISNSIESSIRREQQLTNERVTRMSETTTVPSQGGNVSADTPPRLGSSYRRTIIRPSRAILMRDRL